MSERKPKEPTGSEQVATQAAKPAVEELTPDEAEGVRGGVIATKHPTKLEIPNLK